jgi:phosphate transport system permease protein
MNEAAPKPWAPPAPTFLERLQASLVRAAVVSLLASLAFVLLAFLVRMVGVYAGTAESLPDIRVLAPSAGLLGTALFVVLAPTLLLLSTRPMQNRAFTVCGFLATFFGLAMLVVFFTQLALDVVQWFHDMPRLIEHENQALLEAPRQFEQQQLAGVLRELDEELAKIDADPAMSAQQKKEEKAAIKELFETDIIPGKKKDLAATVQEMERAAERDQRTGTSPPALLWFFLTHGPAPLDKPQEAGIWFALLGSLWLALIVLLFAVPVGVGAAIYLEEYRGAGWLSRIIQVNINNLAGVPSVVYGILGSFVFVGLIFRPLESDAIAARNVLGGGLTLGLLTLPMVIVSAQEAIRAVPSSIRQGAIALGATRWQTTWRTVLPMSLPGILTGTILSLSRAIGEAAPLLLFTGVAFIDQPPTLFSRFTFLPMQIFNWAVRLPTRLPDGESVDAWRENAAMASVVLLVTLLLLNGLAIYLRNRSHRHGRY